MPFHDSWKNRLGGSPDPAPDRTAIAEGTRCGRPRGLAFRRGRETRQTPMSLHAMSCNIRENMRQFNNLWSPPRCLKGGVLPRIVKAQSTLAARSAKRSVSEPIKQALSSPFGNPSPGDDRRRGLHRGRRPTPPRPRIPPLPPASSHHPRPAATRYPPPPQLSKNHCAEQGHTLGLSDPTEPRRPMPIVPKTLAFSPLVPSLPFSNSRPGSRGPAAAPRASRNAEGTRLRKVAGS